MTPPDPQQVAEIAGRLSKAQREAIAGAAKMNSFMYGPDIYEVRAGGATVAMCKKGLIREWAFRSITGKSRRIYVLTVTGLAVRAHLKGNSHD
jgi:hypothetical protein